LTIECPAYLKGVHIDTREADVAELRIGELAEIGSRRAERLQEPASGAAGDAADRG
jgi:hypothetical protein